MTQPDHRATRTRLGRHRHRPRPGGAAHPARPTPGGPAVHSAAPPLRRTAVHPPRLGRRRRLRGNGRLPDDPATRPHPRPTRFRDHRTAHHIEPRVSRPDSCRGMGNRAPGARLCAVQDVHDRPPCDPTRPVPGASAVTLGAAAGGHHREFSPCGEAVPHGEQRSRRHICTPNHTHATMVEAALAAGKPVICQKPLATTVADSQRLAELAEDAGVVTCVPFVYRFYPSVREARARIAAGEAGPLWLLHGSYLQDWLASAEATNWRVDSFRRSGPPSREKEGRSRRGAGPGDLNPAFDGSAPSTISVVPPSSPDAPSRSWRRASERGNDPNSRDP
jgi:hypothetical protein